METKLERKLTDLVAAVSNFRDSLTLQPELFPELLSDTLKSGQIQKFEFTAELLWKTAQAFLYEVDGVDVVTPKGVIKAFYEAEHCGEGDYQLFMGMVNDRNLLSHIYRQELAEDIRLRLPDYLKAAERILHAMEQGVVR